MSSRSAPQTQYTRYLLTCLMSLALIVLSACSSDDETPAEPDFPTQAADVLTPGVHLRIQGQIEQQAINIQLSGSGVFRQIPRHNNRPGYFYIGDGTDTDEFKLTLILPADSDSGVYGLRSTTPFNTGKIFEAKLESKQYGYFEFQTQGFVTLNQLQVTADNHVLSSGTFAFRSLNDQGHALEVIGSFNFDGLKNQ